MAFLIVQQERREIARHELTGPVIVGRGRDCDIVIRDSKVSRHHCRIEPTVDGGWRVQDLGSRNGVVIAGQAVTEATLADGDRLWLGREIRLRFGEGAMPRRRPSDPTEMAELVQAGEALATALPAGPVPMPRKSGSAVGSTPVVDDTSATSTGLSFTRSRRPATPHDALREVAPGVRD
jgi:predicted component of type VI protein secretion system